MSDGLVYTRLLLARRYDEDEPFVVGAVTEALWRLVSPGEWEARKAAMAKTAFGVHDWKAYEYAEAVVGISRVQLQEVFDAQQLKADEVFVGEMKDQR